MKSEILRNKIGFVLCTMFNHTLNFEEDERYIYVCINDRMITNTCLCELIEQGLQFVIDLDDCKESIVIAFLKE